MDIHVVRGSEDNYGEFEVICLVQLLCYLLFCKQAKDGNTPGKRKPKPNGSGKLRTTYDLYANRCDNTHFFMVFSDHKHVRGVGRRNPRIEHSSVTASLFPMEYLCRMLLIKRELETWEES